MLEKTLESPLNSKIKPGHPKGNQSWIFIERTDVEAETPIVWLPDAKSWLIWKAPDAGKDWRQEEKGTTEGEMVGWHHRLNAHEFEQALGVGDGQGSLACCSSWGRKESDTTERLSLSLSPRACSNSCPLSRWCHPTISSSVVPFSSCLQSFPASASFPKSQLFASGSQSIGTSVLAPVLTKVDFLWDRLV